MNLDLQVGVLTVVCRLPHNGGLPLATRILDSRVHRKVQRMPVHLEHGRGKYLYVPISLSKNPTYVKGLP